MALFLKVAEPAAIDAEVFATLGTFAERLARRASARRLDAAAEATLAAQLEVASSYGVGFRSVAEGGRLRLCYEGDAWRRVLALPAAEADRAEAALALTDPACLDPELAPHLRYAALGWRRDVLGAVECARLPSHLAHRVRLRRAAVWASLAFERARRGEPARDAGERALAELAAVVPGELAEDDAGAYAEAAVRVSAVRFAAEVPAWPHGAAVSVVAGGDAGQTCLRVAAAPPAAPLAERCTYGVLWSTSLRSRPDGEVHVAAAQPVDGWRELWVAHRAGGRWTVDVFAPGEDGPGLGYLDFAGWVPRGPRILVAREARRGGRLQRSFEVLRLDTLAVEKSAAAPEALTLFHRHQDPGWKRITLATR